MTFSELRALLVLYAAADQTARRAAEALLPGLEAFSLECAAVADAERAEESPSNADIEG